jgi:uncharacterized cupredoxin-like copper-binding protein
MSTKIRRGLAVGTAVVAVTLLVAACGDTGDGSAPSSGGGRVIAITMTDTTYSPTKVAVGKGETVTLRFRNNGLAVHEAVIGNAEYQMDHEASMTTSTTAGMTDGSHAMGPTGTDNMVTVQPGKTAEMTYRFDESGTMLIGCHQPGHYEAGMKATINVG